MADIKAIAILMMVFRVICMFALVASIAVLVTDQFTNSQGITSTFKDVIAYRYVLSTAVIGAAYAIIQMPFAVYYACTEKRMIRQGFFPEFDFYGDKIISFLLATGVGAGFAFSFELKRMADRIFDLIRALGFAVVDRDQENFLKFLDRAIIATGLLALGFVCMAIVSVCSSVVRSSSRGFWR